MKQVVLCAMRDAYEKIQRIEDGSTVIHQGDSFGDLNNDTEIKADKILGEFFTDRFKETRPRRLAVEGGIDEIIEEQGSQSIFVDPLDGSLNYKSKGETLGLPYTAVVTVFSDSMSNQYYYDGKRTFDCLEGGAVIDLRNGDLWQMFKRGNKFNGTLVLAMSGTMLNGKKCTTTKETKLDIGSQIVFGDFYYPELREKLVRAFAGKKGSLRNAGSAAYEMAMVSSGQAVAFISDRQKQHELGAGYLLVTGAGGVALDFDGGSLGHRIYDFKTQTPVVLAANRAIADQILELLHK